MELNQILERLQSTIDNLKTLDEDHFEFTDFVADFRLVSNISKHHVSGYGVVCDTAGWYPKWYPESGFTWGLTRFSVNLFYQESCHRTFIIEGLMKHHGLSQTLIGVLFFGETLVKNANQENEIWFKSSNNFTLKQTIARFHLMHTGLEMGVINPDWDNKLGS